MKESRTSRVLRATIEYDGARYRGWQSQMNARTVQGALYGAVKPVLGEGTRIFGSGRTDAGVHALGQVASLSLTRSVPVDELPRLRRAINDGLPPDVHVLALQPAPPGFHARHDAALRIYRYRLSRRRTAFGKPWVWWVKDPLDAAAMKKAATLFAGRHDFASFCENAPGHDSTLVEVAWAKVETPASVPDLILFRIAASHFLWKMVRRLVGTLVEVGAGRMSVQKVASFLEAKSTEPARLTAPPSGLFLETVVYEGDPPPPEIDPLRPGW